LILPLRDADPPQTSAQEPESPFSLLLSTVWYRLFEPRHRHTAIFSVPILSFQPLLRCLTQSFARSLVLCAYTGLQKKSGVLISNLITLWKKPDILFYVCDSPPPPPRALAQSTTPPLKDLFPSVAILPGSLRIVLHPLSSSLDSNPAQPCCSSQTAAPLLVLDRESCHPSFFFVLPTIRSFSRGNNRSGIQSQPFFSLLLEITRRLMTHLHAMLFFLHTRDPSTPLLKSPLLLIRVPSSFSLHLKTVFLCQHCSAFPPRTLPLFRRDSHNLIMKICEGHHFSLFSTPPTQALSLSCTIVAFSL